MTTARPPRGPETVLRLLLPGPLGEEARLELAYQYRACRGSRGPLAANLWYVGQLVHPHTWALAAALRRRDRRHASPLSPNAAGRSWISWLDVKLGMRLLARYPIMTAVSGLAIMVTIAVAVATFALFQDFLLQPSVPLPEPDRVVSLGLKNVETRRNERHLLHEIDAWREQLEGVQHLGLWRQERRTLVGSDGTGDVVRTAVMSASGFAVAQVPPLIGRPLLPSDEVAGAPRVVVLGYEPWIRRFDADPDVVGRHVVLGGEPHTIVGVMPEGFGFPYAERFWLPMDDPEDWSATRGPGGYYAFGRLAPDVTLAQADAELKALTRRRAADMPETHRHLAGRVMVFTDAYTGMDEGSMLIWFHRLILSLITLLVLIPFCNVVILVYARTATRIGEIAVRRGLGASRRRIVLQLLVEALLVAVPSALVGVVVGLLTLEYIDRLVALYFGSGMPFWAHEGQDPWVIGYAATLALFAAILAAVIPGLRATGRRAHEHLKAAAGRYGVRLGPVWTSLVVVQVAITVAGLPLAGWVAWDAIGLRIARPVFRADDYLGVWVAAGPSGPPAPAAPEAGTAAEQIAEVVRRVEALPGVTGVRLSDRSPTDVTSTSFSSFYRLEIDGVDPPEDGGGHRVVDLAVDPGFFALLDIPVRAGREFLPGDAGGPAAPVLVSRAFVERTLHGANAIGRRVRRYRSPEEEPAPWREIIGVVDDPLENPLRPHKAEGMVFLPLDRANTAAAHLTIRAPGLPPSLTTEVGRVVAGVDPSLRLDWSAPLTQPRDPIRTLMAGVAAVILLVLCSVLCLAAAGVFSLISFNVTRRRREIGIRTALGARPGQVLLALMARPIRQLAVGVAVGAFMVAIVPPLSVDGTTVPRDPRLLVLVACVLVLMGLVAAWGPARTGLRIQPMDALREE